MLEYSVVDSEWGLKAWYDVSLFRFIRVQELELL